MHCLKRVKDDLDDSRAEELQSIGNIEKIAFECPLDLTPSSHPISRAVRSDKSYSLPMLFVITLVFTNKEYWKLLHKTVPVLGSHILMGYASLYGISVNRVSGYP